MNVLVESSRQTEKLLYALSERLLQAKNKKFTINDNDTASYGDLFADKLKINTLILNGLSYSLFEKIQKGSTLSKSEWANFLDLSIRTLDRYKTDNKKFKASQSEKIIGMIEVMGRGYEVFGDMENFKLWLHTPNYALGKEKPIDLLGNAYGRELVNTELTHIDYGIFA